MPTTIKINVVACAALLFPVFLPALLPAQQDSSAQRPSNGSPKDVVMQRVLSIDLAQAIADGALKECRAQGYHTAVAVVDRSGQVMAILRDEGAVPQTTEMARRKAYTAVLFRSTTLEFQKRTAAEPLRAPQRDVADVLALGGGVPIQVGSEIIGGVASSGASPEADDACAKAGIAKVAARIK